MKTNEAARSWSVVSRLAGLLIAALIGWLWFIVAEDPDWKALAWKALPLVVALPLAARIGIKWLRVRARRRLGAAWDAYAARELAKRAYSGRSFHARPQ
jgi:hypothetical protein